MTETTSPRATRTPTKPEPVIRKATLTFEPDGETVSYDWHYEEIDNVLCGLCARGCTEEQRAQCLTIAKFCG
jgi:hypothetical protein